MSTKPAAGERRLDLKHDEVVEISAPAGPARPDGHPTVRAQLRDGEALWGRYAVTVLDDDAAAIDLELLDGPIEKDGFARTLHFRVGWHGLRPGVGPHGGEPVIVSGAVIERDAEPAELDPEELAGQPRLADASATVDWLMTNDPLLHLLRQHGYVPDARIWAAKAGPAFAEARKSGARCLAVLFESQEAAARESRPRRGFWSRLFGR